MTTGVDRDRSHESIINDTLARFLRERCSLSAVAETLHDGRRPDIIVRLLEGPVILEIELEPALTVEADALSRLGMEIGGRKVQNVFSVTVPGRLRSTSQQHLYARMAGATLVWQEWRIDGLAKPERRARYGEVMRLYRGDGQRTTRHAPAQAVGPGRPHGAADRIALARKKWASAAPIPTDPEHPARRWLAARHLWRPDLQLPPSVRWLEASGGPSVGGLLAAFAPPGHGQPSGVQLVSVDGDGRPAPDRAGPTGLAKRSIGVMRGAVCVLGLPDAVSGVNVAEGLADVLALASRLPWPAICTGGSGGFKNHDLARWLAGLGAVHVWADLDEPDGIEAAGVLAGRVVVLGGVSWIERVGVGADPREAGAPFPPLDAAAVESYAGDLERDGLPTWEARRLASVICAKLE